MGEHQARVDIVIVGHDQFDLTARCLDSIIANTDPEAYRVIYVDNGSNPAALETAFFQHDLDSILRLNKNTGFPHGANCGIALALVSEAPYVLLLNNDTEIQDGDEDWLERLMDAMDDPKVGGVGAVSDRVAGYQLRKNSAEGTPWQVPLLVYFAVLLRKSAIRQVGMLDERFSPGNYEDFDHSVRLTQAGWKLMVDPRVWIRHIAHASHGGIDLAQLLETNRCKFVDKWGADVARQVGIG